MSLKIPEPPYTEIEDVMRRLEAALLESERLHEPDEKQANHLAPPLILSGKGESDLKALLDAAESAKAIGPDYRVASHRPILGFLADAIKKVVLWAARPQLEQMREKQEKFNSASLAAAREMAAFHARSAKALQSQLESLRQQNALRVRKFLALRGMTFALTELILDLLRTQAELREALSREHHAAERRLKHLDEALEKAMNEARAISREEAIAAVARLEDLIGKNEKAIQSLISRHDLTSFFEKAEPQKRRALMDHFRGPRDMITERFQKYVDFFRSRPGQILDVGCGRGEFLELLRFNGIESWGCDLDASALASCDPDSIFVRNLGALEALESVADGSLGGVFSAQVVEHMFPGELLAFLKLARRKIAPGGVMVIETLNPQSLGVLSKSYYRDLEHKQPIDPDYMAELVSLAGFTAVKVERIHPFPHFERLPELPSAQQLWIPESAHASLLGIYRRLNDTLFGPQDYFVVGELTEN